MTDAALVLELRLLRQQVAELCDEQQHLLRALLGRDDRRAGLVLLPLIAELLGAATFTAASLMHAAMADRSSTGQAAREVLADLATDEGGLRAFGRLLARLEGVPLAGARLVRVGDSRDGMRWRLQRVSGDE